MEDYNKLEFTSKSTYNDLLEAAKEARLARLAETAQPTPPHRLTVIMAATAIILGMVLVLAVVL